MAWKDWRKEVPKLRVDFECFDLKRRSTGQREVLFRLVGPLEVKLLPDRGRLWLPNGLLSDGSSVPSTLWGALDATPADLLLPGFVHDYAYRRGARLLSPDGKRRAIDRYTADLLHIGVCRLLRVRKSDQAKIFFALRVAGRFSFRQRELDWDGRSA